VILDIELDGTVLLELDWSDVLVAGATGAFATGTASLDVFVCALPLLVGSGGVVTALVEVGWGLCKVVDEAAAAAQEVVALGGGTGEKYYGQ
jgi:hypothetical protein